MCSTNRLIGAARGGNVSREKAFTANGVDYHPMQCHAELKSVLIPRSSTLTYSRQVCRGVMTHTIQFVYSVHSTRYLEPLGTLCRFSCKGSISWQVVRFVCWQL